MLKLPGTALALARIRETFKRTDRWRGELLCDACLEVTETTAAPDTVGQTSGTCARCRTTALTLNRAT